MESSRIFIRGLPSSLTAEDFKKHFSKQSSITDAKFIPHRRIGYVGYKSPEDAARAVKYHNKTFIRMSRIGVELARSIEEQSALRIANNFANGGKRQYREVAGETTSEAGFDSNKKRKPDTEIESGGKAKLQEFLEVMQPPSKSKIWENQDTTTMSATTERNEIAVKGVELEKQSDGEYEPVPKKRKSDRRTIGKEEVIEIPQEKSVTFDDKRDVPDVQKVSKNEGQKPADKLPATDETPAASDADWLRSRTSRLLGLVDDEDASAHTNALDYEDNQKDVVSPAREHVEGVGRSDAGVQTHEEVDNEDPVALSLRIEDPEDAALESRRLFIRNLTYTTTEDELRRHFENGGYGDIEEVRQKSPFRFGTSFDAFL